MQSKRSSRRSTAITRRDFLRVGGLAGAASILGGCSARSPAITPLPTMRPWPTSGPTAEGGSPAPSPVPAQVAAVTHGAQAPEGEGAVAVRFAHISDMHIQPSGPGAGGFARALRQLQTRNPEMDFVMNTGDCVMDTLHTQEGRRGGAVGHVPECDRCRMPVADPPRDWQPGRLGLGSAAGCSEITAERSALCTGDGVAATGDAGAVLFV